MTIKCDFTFFELPFSLFLAENPTQAEWIEWNYRRVLQAISRGDSHHAALYASETVRWARS